MIGVVSRNEGRLNVKRMQGAKLATVIGRILLVCFVAVMFGWAPNPADRFFEAGPRTYRNYADVLQVTGSEPLRTAVKAVLEQDGRLTQSNLKDLSPAYERALPTGYVYRESSPDDIAVERGRLIELVGANRELH